MLCASRRDSSPVRQSQQARVEALAHLPVRIAEPEVLDLVVPLLADHGEVAGLEQQRRRCDAAHVEGAQQFLAGDHAV